ncbi:nitrate reductase molybdenum cofactor assembly chaperone [Amycolatopsis rhizosphaerae]|uniref:Nitrate reductase molybdenum cofactor assembly chaperone n=1 Tax=Amycolatopsis rhizosphaerae TaxID=2053003 RepID=A0A558CRW1_9PSEU|nr:nitrate reductase molybdenum cofactor assembly chaperone [Amycolatopsis rhizosphaerae]TVT51510.1 nitrate reductase molybdenum cofactor assembly chaperone [Amycolatopsis rhizosphaerae]
MSGGRNGGRNGTEPEPAVAWQAQSLLVDYPYPELFEHVPLLREAAAGFAEPVGEPLERFLDHLEGTPAMELQSQYVATFDHRKLGSLYLTYYTCGDTRKRGMALLRFLSAYRRAGLELGEGELPDHLAVVLEFAATVDPVAGRRLLCEHRAGLELLRRGLHEIRSPWAHVLDSVSATLPALRGSDHEAIARLIRQGPPEEEVGLDPFHAADHLFRGVNR